MICLDDYIIFPNSLHHIWPSYWLAVREWLRLWGLFLRGKHSLWPVFGLYPGMTGRPQPILSIFLYSWLFLHLGSLVSFDLRSKLLTTLSFLWDYFGDRKKAERENYPLESLTLEADVDVYYWKKINIEDINIIKCKLYHPLISYYRDKLFLRTSSKA